MEMYSVDKTLITYNDVEIAFKHSVDDTKEEIKNGTGMVADGRYLYYANGYDYPVEIRGL